MSAYEVLICRIFEQAIEDYDYLMKNNIESKRDICGEYSIEDLEKFFKSKRSSQLLEMIGSELTGSDVLRRIQKKYPPREVAVV